MHRWHCSMAYTAAAHRLRRHARLERRGREREVHVVALPAVRGQPQLPADHCALGHHQRLLQHAPQLKPACVLHDSLIGAVAAVNHITRLHGGCFLA